jgi:hypothetical protein
LVKESGQLLALLEFRQSWCYEFMLHGMVIGVACQLEPWGSCKSFMSSQIFLFIYLKDEELCAHIDKTYKLQNRVVRSQWGIVKANHN